MEIRQMEITEHYTVWFDQKQGEFQFWNGQTDRHRDKCTCWAAPSQLKSKDIWTSPSKLLLSTFTPHVLTKLISSWTCHLSFESSLCSQPSLPEEKPKSTLWYQIKGFQSKSRTIHMCILFQSHFAFQAMRGMNSSHTTNTIPMRVIGRSAHL